MKLNRREALGVIGGTAAASMIGMPAFANTKVNVGALRFTSHAGTFVAFERGYFADAGFDVELKFFQAAQPMAVAVASGDADFAVTAISGGLVSLADKGAVKVVGGALSEEPGIFGQQILVSNAAFDAGVTAPSMLGGRSYGMTQAGSSFHYMGSKVAASEGIDVSFKPLQKVGAIIGALKSGQIDAWSIVPHIAKPLDGSGAAHIIGAIADYIPNYQVTTVFTSTENAEAEREKTTAFLSAFSRGVDDFNAALVDKTEGADAAEEMVQLIHKYVNADKPLDDARAGITVGSMRLNKNAALNVASVRDQIDWFKSEGLIKDSIAFDTVVDQSYVEIV